MRKPESLRAFLAAAVPQIAAEPALLQVFVDGGRVVPRAPAEGPSPGVSGYEYRYRLQLALLDFAGAPDQVMVPLLNWLAVHQSELVLNPERAKEAIAFRVEILDPGKVDLEIELQLTESFGVRPRPGGGGSGGRRLRHGLSRLADGGQGVGRAGVRGHRSAGAVQGDAEALRGDASLTTDKNRVQNNTTHSDINSE